MSTKQPDRGEEQDRPVADPRPRYEPPRIVKKRSVARATLASPAVSGSGPMAGGLTANG